jgi:hypothetical protein
LARKNLIYFIKIAAKLFRETKMMASEIHHQIFPGNGAILFCRRAQAIGRIPFMLLLVLLLAGFAVSVIDTAFFRAGAILPENRPRMFFFVFLSFTVPVHSVYTFSSFYNDAMPAYLIIAPGIWKGT